MATTIDIEKVNGTAEKVAKPTEESAYTMLDYAVKSQEINTRFLQRVTEAWIEGFRSQTELSRKTSQKLFEGSEDQADAFREFAEQWGFRFQEENSPFETFMRFPYDPFSFQREWKRLAETTMKNTQAVVKDTARTVDTLAARNGNGGLPIPGYDGMNVEEIARRIDTLSTEELKKVRDYEKRNKNRATVLQEIDRKVKAATS